MHSQIISKLEPRVQLLVNQKGDTLLQMHIEDAKIVLSDLLEKEYADSMLVVYGLRDNLNASTISLQLSQIKLLQEKSLNQELQASNLNKIITNKDTEIVYLNDIVKKQKKEIRNPLMQGERYTSYGWKQLNPDNPNYFASLYVQARQFREAEVTKRMLQIDTSLGKRHVVSQLNKIKKWFVSDDRLAQIEFRNTKVQKALVLDTTKKLTRKEKKQFAIKQEKRKQSKYDIDNYIASRWNEVQSYFPDQSVRFDIANRPYEKIPSAYELESRLGQLQLEGKLSPIPGEAIGKTKFRGIQDVPKIYSISIDTLFKYLGTMPEDAFTRVPFYGNVYQKAIDTGGNALALKVQRRGKPAAELEIQGVEKATHREA